MFIAACQDLGQKFVEDLDCKNIKFYKNRCVGFGKIRQKGEKSTVDGCKEPFIKFLESA